VSKAPASSGSSCKEILYTHITRPHAHGRAHTTYMNFKEINISDSAQDARAQRLKQKTHTHMSSDEGEARIVTVERMRGITRTPKKCYGRTSTCAYTHQHLIFCFIPFGKKCVENFDSALYLYVCEGQDKRNCACAPIHHLSEVR